MGEQRDFDKFTVMQIFISVIVLFLPDTAPWITKMIDALNVKAKAANHKEACSVDTKPHIVVYTLFTVQFIQIALSVYENKGLYLNTFNQQRKDFMRWMKIFTPVALFVDIVGLAVCLTAMKEVDNTCPSIFFTYCVFDMSLNFLKIINMYFQFEMTKKKVIRQLN